jgi:hypothetical protein
VEVDATKQTLARPDEVSERLSIEFLMKTVRETGRFFNARIYELSNEVYLWMESEKVRGLFRRCDF